MATVVREIERKYDPATAGTVALEAVTAMTGTAGVTAVSRQAEQLLDAVYYDNAALTPVVHIQTSRRVLRLLDQASRTLAEIAADHVSAEPADGAAATSWDEIEAELITGDPKLLKAIDTRLRKAGARPAATATKLQRALGGRLPAAKAAQGPPLTATSPAGEVVLADPPLTPLAERQAGKVLAKPVRRAERRLQHALAAVPGAADRDAAIHQARKATKRARYAAEAAVPALGGAARRQTIRAKELQQLLGDHHDSGVARTVLLDLAAQARAAGEDTFAYGLMHQSQACQAAKIEQALPQFAAPAK